jgi:hypothetical protein
MYPLELEQSGRGCGRGHDGSADDEEEQYGGRKRTKKPTAKRRTKKRSIKKLSVKKRSVKKRSIKRSNKRSKKRSVKRSVKSSKKRSVKRSKKSSVKRSKKRSVQRSKKSSVKRSNKRSKKRSVKRSVKSSKKRSVKRSKKSSVKRSKKNVKRKSRMRISDTDTQENLVDNFVNKSWNKFKWWKRIAKNKKILVLKDGSYKFVSDKLNTDDMSVKANIVSGESSDNLFNFVYLILEKYPDTLDLSDKKRLDFYIDNLNKFFVKDNNTNNYFLKGNSKPNYKRIIKNFNL